MATIDHRRGLGNYRIGAEIALKIWQWNKDKGAGRFELNTRIDRPHDKERVTSLSFAPGRLGQEQYVLLTSGENRTLRTWGLETTKAAKNTEQNSECTQ